MSDHEFENYLTLIGRLLRLSRTQRQAIGEELRDHFESRLAELTGRDISHAEAVRIALEEFGDAAGLAAHFSSIAQTRKRRIIMRCTVASVTALAAAFVVALCLWPDTPAHKLIPHATADGTDKQPAEAVQKDLDKLVKAAQNLPDSLTAEKEAELNDQFGQFEFQGTPLTDVLDYFQNAHHTAEYYIDGPSLKDAGIDPTTTLVTISFKHVRLKTFLDLMLSPFNLGYHFRDGIMIITTHEKLDATLETRVYDCRDILAAYTGEFQQRTSHYLDSLKAPTQTPAASAGATPGSMLSQEPSAASPAMGPYSIPSGFAGRPRAADMPSATQTDDKVTDKPHTATDDLVVVITTAVAPQTWIIQGGPGTICDYDGLLVVSQTAARQSEVADLLEKLSARLSSRPGKSNDPAPGPK